MEAFEQSWISRVSVEVSGTEATECSTFFLLFCIFFTCIVFQFFVFIIIIYIYFVFSPFLVNSMVHSKWEVAFCYYNRSHILGRSSVETSSKVLNISRKRLITILSCNLRHVSALVHRLTILHEYDQSHSMCDPAHSG
jgi:hypothetical protein